MLKRARMSTTNMRFIAGMRPSEAENSIPFVSSEGIFLAVSPRESRAPKTFDLSSVDRTRAVRETIDVLNAGGCVALPTDTLYGLVTLLRFSSRLFEVKQRDEGKPVGFFVHSPAVIRKFAVQTVEDGLLDRLLPGRVTLLFRRLESVGLPQNNTELVGFRIPDDEFVRELCRNADEPLAQTSANLSGAPSAIAPEEFFDLWPSLDLLIVDSQRKMDEKRQGSTIIDLSEAGGYRICRPGCSLVAYEGILQEHGLKPL